MFRVKVLNTAWFRVKVLNTAWFRVKVLNTAWFRVKIILVNVEQEDYGIHQLKRDH